MKKGRISLCKALEKKVPVAMGDGEPILFQAKVTTWAAINGYSARG